MTPAPATGPARLVRAARPDRAPVVSVCIPVYQGARHLASTLRSVLEQTLVEVEVVVLDNASTDGTPAILDAVDDPRLAVWRNPATVEMGENFNRVVALSTAPLVKILPADDLLEPDCLARQVEALDDPRVALVASRSHIVDDHGRPLVRDRFLRGMRGRLDRTDVVRRVVRHTGNPIGGDVATTYRRRDYEAVGGYPSGGLHADVVMWLLLLEQGDLVALDATHARFRIAAGTASAGAGRDAYRAQRRFVREIARDAADEVRRRDLLCSRLQAPLALARRQLLFALDRLRPGPAAGPGPDAAAGPAAEPAVVLAASPAVTAVARSR